jgi:hypothetical protein
MSPGRDGCSDRWQAGGRCAGARCGSPSQRFGIAEAHHGARNRALDCDWRAEPYRAAARRRAGALRVNPCSRPPATGGWRTPRRSARRNAALPTATTSVRRRFPGSHEEGISAFGLGLVIRMDGGPKFGKSIPRTTKCMHFTEQWGELRKFSDYSSALTALMPRSVAATV